MKAQECTCVVNTRIGYCLTPQQFPSINKAVKWAKESCGFAYRIFANGKVVRSGFCD